jgi:guanylate kinase
LEKALLDRRADLELAVSATTRDRRPSEQDGREYWFLVPGEFERRVEAGDFLEWVQYVGQKYGTLRSEIDRIAAAGRVPLLDLEIEGALNVRDSVPGAVTVFVDAPLDELERRLRERATESTGEIGERVELAQEQKTRAGEFDYVVENRDLGRAVEELLGIVDRELAAAGSMQA